jgi:hypothetical protein
MRRLLLACVSFTAVFAADTAKRYTDLLADKKLAAWELLTPATADATTAGKFGADGSFALHGRAPGFLATKAAYKNYRLHAEWRWPTNATERSAAVLVFHFTPSRAGGATEPAAVQVQLKPARVGDVIPMGEIRFAEKTATPAGATAPQLDRLTVDSEKGFGQWNTCDLVSRDGVVEILINGVVQNRVTECAPAAGRIGFRLDGGAFDLRNVRVAPLD